METRRLAEFAEHDDDGNVIGFQFDGRERRIQEWRDRQEEKQYEELFRRLQSRNSARRALVDPVRRVRVQAADRRHRESGKKQRRENERRREQYEQNPIVNICEQCGVGSTVPYEKRGKKRTKFCSRKCRNRHHGQKRARSKGLRKMDIRESVFRYLEQTGSATCRQIAKAIEGKQPSVATCCSRWVKQGLLVSTGGRQASYSLPVRQKGES